MSNDTADECSRSYKPLAVRRVARGTGSFCASFEDVLFSGEPDGLLVFPPQPA